MTAAAPRLLRAFRDPATVGSLDIRGWNALLREARRLDLLSRLAVILDDAGPGAALPAKVRDHLEGARAVAEQHQRVVRWEVNRILHALGPLGVRVVLLKGAAYVLGGLPPARGRLVGDVDILVPERRLAEVERALLGNGWEAIKLDPYDQRYYRTWMHELPPLRHRERRTVVDVHHRILPRSGKLHPDPEKLLARAVPLDAEGGAAVLCPEDMVLHGAAHLFQDGDLAGGLRDLVDLDDLLRRFADARPRFWDELAERADDLGLTRPLFYALRFCRAILGTPVPDRAADGAGRPAWPAAAVMDSLATRALLPDEAGGFGIGAARWLLYVRSHWLRMPLWLLGAHLTRKFFHRLRADEA